MKNKTFILIITPEIRQYLDYKASKGWNRSEIIRLAIYKAGANHFL